MAEVGNFVARLLRRYWVMPVAITLGLCGAFLYMQIEGPTYTSRAIVIVAATVESTGSREISYAQIFSRTISQPEVLAPAADEVGLSIEELKSRMKGNPSTEAPSVELWSTASSPDASAKYANAVARALIAYGNARTPDTSVRLALLGEAFPPTTTSSPRLQTLAIGGSAGLLLGGFALMVGVGRTRSSSRHASVSDAADPTGADDVAKNARAAPQHFAHLPTEAPGRVEEPRSNSALIAGPTAAHETRQAPND